MLTQTVPAVLAGGGFEALLVVEVDEVLLALEVLDELDGAGELAGAGAAVGAALGGGAEFALAVGVEDAGVEADSLESLFFERLFFLVAPEFAAGLSVA